MAHFAELNPENVVLRVVSVSNDACRDAAGVESEQVGAALCERLFGGRWIQTSYNARIRKNFAGIGYRYDEQRDAFIPPQKFPSWVLDESACRWKAPVPHPASGMHRWNESLRRWDSVN